jgi:hypothetical protein
MTSKTFCKIFFEREVSKEGGGHALYVEGCDLIEAKHLAPLRRIVF